MKRHAAAQVTKQRPPTFRSFQGRAADQRDLNWWVRLLKTTHQLCCEAILCRIRPPLKQSISDRRMRTERGVDSQTGCHFHRRRTKVFVRKSISFLCRDFELLTWKRGCRRRKGRNPRTQRGVSGSCLTRPRWTRGSDILRTK